MSTLVIEWDRDRLIAVSGVASGRSVTIQNATTIPREHDQTAESLGPLLANELSTAGFSAGSAIAVLPRSLVTLRRIRLPEVTTDELPDMVRLQAATVLSVPVDSVALDFVPIPGESGHQNVLVATVPANTIATIRSTFDIAGLELAGVHVSSFGIASALAHAGHLKSGDDQTESIITLRSDMIEFMLAHGRTVDFSHTGASSQTVDEIDGIVRSEISRGRMSATESIGPHTIHQVTLVGGSDHTTSIPDDVTRRLDNAVIQRIDPADSIVQGNLSDGLSATDVLAAAGVIATQHKETVAAVDLINPRRPVEKPDTRRLKALLSVGAAVLLCVGGWKWRDNQLQHLGKEISTLESQASALTSEFKQAKDEIEKDEAIQEWSASNIDWLDEMNNIRELMGGTERLLIRRFTFSVSRGTSRGTINAECLGRERRDIEEFQRRLKLGGYDVIARSIEPGGRDSDYAMQVPLEIQIPFKSEEDS